MGTRKRLSSASPFEVRFGFCRALRVGNTVHVAGTAPIGDDGQTVGAGDVAAQARRCFDVIQRALQHFGAGLDDVVRTRMFLTDIDDWPIVGGVHGEYFRAARPVSTMVAVTRLIDADWRVEIEAQAVLDD